MQEIYPSLSDIAAVTGGNNKNNGAFGGDGIWAFLLLALFGYGGFGNGGGIFGGRNNGGAAEGYVLANDMAFLSRQIDSSTASTERKLDSISNGICDSTFALNNTMTNGFAATQQTLCQGFSGVNQAITSNGYETRLGVNQLGYNLQDCCCTLRQEIANTSCATQRAIDSVNYNMAMNTNVLQNTLCNNTRDIIENQNANYRALHDEIVANRIEDKNAQIAAQQNEINALRLSASQERQNAYLLNELKPCPSPSYLVPNPNCCYNYGYTNNCGCNNF